MRNVRWRTIFMPPTQTVIVKAEKCATVSAKPKKTNPGKIKLTQIRNKHKTIVKICCCFFGLNKNYSLHFMTAISSVSTCSGSAVKQGTCVWGIFPLRKKLWAAPLSGPSPSPGQPVSSSAWQLCPSGAPHRSSGRNNNKLHLLLWLTKLGVFWWHVSILLGHIFV